LAARSLQTTQWELLFYHYNIKCMDAWMDMNVWMHGCMDGYECTDAWMGMDVWMHGCVRALPKGDGGEL
jgi:hypothetical protein